VQEFFHSNNDNKRTSNIPNISNEILAEFNISPEKRSHLGYVTDRRTGLGIMMGIVIFRSNVSIRLSAEEKHIHVTCRCVSILTMGKCGITFEIGTFIVIDKMVYHGLSVYL